MPFDREPDFTMVAGDHKSLMFPLDDEYGAPLNVVGARIVWALTRYDPERATPSDAPLLVKSTDAGGITIADTLDGWCQVDLEPADTLQTPAVLGLHAYALRVTRDGRQTTHHRGLVRIQPAIGAAS